MRGLLDAASKLEADAPTRDELEGIVGRGVFRPGEDEAFGFWFARLLTTRENLKALIEQLTRVVDKPTNKVEEDELDLFLVAYAAACTLVRIDRLLLFGIADHSLIQRKLNEPFPEYRIPSKQYTAIYRWFVDHANAMAMLDAMQFAGRNRPALLALADDPDVGFLASQLAELESSLDARKRTYIRIAWDYVSHKWRRRGKAGAETFFATVMEGLGRAASEVCDTTNKRVTDEIRAEIAAFLEPGDVLVTRHALALTNLFLPGFWPHAAFYVGTAEQRSGLGVTGGQWPADVATLEALKDGVKLRPLSETLAVDSFVVLRPRCAADTIREAIERAVVHEGKQYNFDFDFFTSDRMVCTEVVYRAYDGLEEFAFPLQDRGGRKTLSAEDVLDYAVNGGPFQPVAIFGVEGCETAIVYDADAHPLLLASYRA